MSIRRLLTVAITIVLVSAATARAQTPQPQPATDPTPQGPQVFGPGINIHVMTAATMSALNSATTYIDQGPGASFSRVRTGGGTDFGGAVIIPVGSLLEVFELDACDTNASSAVSAVLWRCPLAGMCETLASVNTGAAQTPGCAQFINSAISNPTVNGAFHYLVQVSVTGSDNTTTFSAVRLGWRRQVSPTPGTATFADVPVGHPFHQFVEALAASAITAGCGAGNYCPDTPLTRGQMAVFLSTALGLHWPN